MTLDEYFCQSDDAPQSLASRCGIHVKTIEKLRRTGSVPNGTVMKAIYQQTKGRVTPFDFWQIGPLHPIVPVPPSAAE